MFNTLLLYLLPFTSFLPYIALSIFIWIVYCYTLTCSAVIDDQDGMMRYDGKLQGFQYGMIIRWIRWHIVGGNTPSKHPLLDQNGKETDKFIIQAKVPSRHHFLSIITFNLAIIATYPWLSHLTSPLLSFLTLLIFICFPITSQVVSWISAIGYTLALLWLSLSLDLVFFYNTLPHNDFITLGIFTIFAILQLLMVEALASTVLAFILFAFLNQWSFALVSLAVGLFCGLNVIRATFKLRKDVFVEQDMKNFSKFSIRKSVVALKTLAYYTYLILWPHRLGLYHKFGYHYDHKLELMDWRSYTGIVVLLGLITAFIFGNPIIQLSCILFLCFVFSFLNWFTVQQFITERYIFLPSLGFCLALAFLTVDYPVVIAFILGCYLVRTLLHLPTYDNEVRFYQSNIWNFPESEVPYGNLGCVYLTHGYQGAALDNWKMSAQLNPDYDVPSYNIFSHYKSFALMLLGNGDLNGCIKSLMDAEPHLKKCLQAKTCHFRDRWQKEYDEITMWIRQPYTLLPIEKKRLEDLNKVLMERKSKSKDPKDILGIDQSLNDIKVRLEQIDKAIIKSKEEPCKKESVSQAVVDLSGNTLAS